MDEAVKKGFGHGEQARNEKVKVLFPEHALFEMKRRQIERELVEVEGRFFAVTAYKTSRIDKYWQTENRE